MRRGSRQKEGLEGAWVGYRGYLSVTMGDMNVIVCVKQIPDPAAPGALDGATNTLKRDGKLILDDSDAYGVEMALQLVDKAGGGEVSLVSMAPNGETSGLRTALAMGAAKGVLVSDPALQGSDALTTAKFLQQQSLVLVEQTSSLAQLNHQTVTPEQCQNKLLNFLVFLP